MGLEFDKDWLTSQIKLYLEYRFGSFNKNDFEVLIFQSILRHEKTGRSNYDLSRILRIPETKVKRLRYEADLKFNFESDYIANGPSSSEIQKEHDTYDKKKYHQFISIIENAQFKLSDRNKLQFHVEDIALRLFLENILIKKGSFADSSFNSNIVTISFSDLCLLLNYDEEGKNFQKEIERRAKDAIKEYNKEAGTSLSFNQSLILESIKTVGEVAKTTGTALDMFSGKKFFDVFTDKIGDLLKKMTK